jgi:cell division protein FtsZ
LEDEFYITSAEVREIEVREPEFVAYKEEEITFLFDLPINTPKVEAPKEEQILFELTEETKDIQVNQPVQVVPMTELNESGIIRYSLEEYLEIENELIDSKPAATIVEEPIAEELNITMKQVDTSSAFNQSFEAISPMEMSIEETLKFRADERRKKLKDFNYKFHNNPSKVEEFEKEPAYKRSGVDISNTQINNPNSRMSLGLDSNDDIQLRSNNSFLHDNVD